MSILSTILRKCLQYAGHGQSMGKNGCNGSKDGQKSQRLSIGVLRQKIWSLMQCRIAEDSQRKKSQFAFLYHYRDRQIDSFWTRFIELWQGEFFGIYLIFICMIILCIREKITIFYFNGLSLLHFFWF